MTHDPAASLSSVASDHALAAAIAGGDTRAFETLFRTHYPGMCAFAARLVTSRDVAEDLVQEVFLYVWRNREVWRVERSVRQYLYAALRHGALRYLRHDLLPIRQPQGKRRSCLQDLLSPTHAADYLVATEPPQKAPKSSLCETPSAGSPRVREGRALERLTNLTD